jgi:hypothetical protein
MPMELYKALQPFLLIITTAIISHYLIPKITKRWQDHQKELELKTGFVTEISESVLGIVMAIQFAEVGAKSQTQDQFDNAYRDWEIKKAIIGSKIRGYFPHTTLGPDWDEFSDMVSEVYALSGTADKDFRNTRLNELKQYFSTDSVDWKSLENLQLKKEGFIQFQVFYKAWFSLRKTILEKKDVLVQRILDSRIALFTN